jgi:hypothetical protein
MKIREIIFWSQSYQTFFFVKQTFFAIKPGCFIVFALFCESLVGLVPGFNLIKLSGAYLGASIIIIELGN